MGELQERMTLAEFNMWCSYRAKHGPMNSYVRADQGAAIIASLIANTHGGKTKPIDFMPHAKAEPEIVDEEQFLSALMSTGRAEIARDGKRR